MYIMSAVVILHILYLHPPSKFKIYSMTGLITTIIYIKKHVKFKTKNSPLSSTMSTFDKLKVCSYLVV